MDKLLEAKHGGGHSKGVPLASILAEMSSTECVVRVVTSDLACTTGDATNVCVSCAQVCLDAISDQIFLPCNHICACKKCANLFQNGPSSDPNCPRCRTPIEQIRTVRFSGI